MADRPPSRAPDLPETWPDPAAPALADRYTALRRRVLELEQAAERARRQRECYRGLCDELQLGGDGAQALLTAQMRPNSAIVDQLNEATQLGTVLVVPDSSRPDVAAVADIRAKLEADGRPETHKRPAKLLAPLEAVQALLKKPRGEPARPRERRNDR